MTALTILTLVLACGFFVTGTILFFLISLGILISVGKYQDMKEKQEAAMKDILDTIKFQEDLKNVVNKAAKDNQ